MGKSMSKRVGVLLVPVLALFFIAACSGVASAPITEGQVRELLQGVDLASTNRDANGIVLFLSKDAEIRFTVHGAIDKELRLSRTAYRDRLQRGFDEVSDYRYRRTDAHIKMTDDGRGATVNSVIKESANVNGSPLHTDTRLILTIARRASGPLITRVEGEIRER